MVRFGVVPQTFAVLQFFALCRFPDVWILVFGLQKSNLHYTRRITSTDVTSGRPHLRGSVPEQHSSLEVSQRGRSVGDTVCDFTYLGLEPQTDSNDLKVKGKGTGQWVQAHIV